MFRKAGWLVLQIRERKNGQLVVTDLARRKQWQASPNTAGHIRDFYRLSDEQLDPS
jgi:hypothetical protein